MTLDTVKVGREYRVSSCDAPLKIRNKLETLGLVPGEHVSVLQSTGAGLIIGVKDSRLALSHDLANCLIVS